MKRSVLLLTILLMAALSTPCSVMSNAQLREDVPLFRGNPARTGAMPGPGPEGEPVELWRFESGGLLASTPIIAQGTVFAGSTRGLHAIDAMTGSELWTFEESTEAFAPAFDDGIVYVPVYDGGLFAVDAGSGQKIWHSEYGGSFGHENSPAIVDGLLFPANHYGLAFAIDLANGGEVWRRLGVPPLAERKTASMITITIA